MAQKGGRVEYKILQSTSQHELEGLVNEQLSQGWQLYGDLQVAAVSSQREAEHPGATVALYCQALTKG